jgi:hypothetical protein
MRVRLVDIDSRIPNLALMQASAWHKNRGDEVGFDVTNPEKVYVSCIFTKNAWKARGAATFYPGAEVSMGGPGISYAWLPEAMQKVKPDYDLYPMDASLGFTTRGCCRNCDFCIVRDKEGPLKRWQPIRAFHDERFGAVRLLDNNALGLRSWFFEQTDYLIDHGLKVDYIGGLDARILDDEIAERLAALKWSAKIRFAWDDPNDEETITAAIAMLKRAGITTRGKVNFYVIVGTETTPFETGLYRCRRLKQLGAGAYIMRYTRTPELNALARWANAKQLFWSMDFDEYKAETYQRETAMVARHRRGAKVSQCL